MYNTDNHKFSMKEETDKNAKKGGMREESGSRTEHLSMKARKLLSESKSLSVRASASCEDRHGRHGDYRSLTSSLSPMA